MELGAASSSSTSNSSSSSVADHSINGLKFGQKIYFEDHVVAGTAGAQLGRPAVSGGGGGGAAAAGGSSSSGLPPPPTPAKKGRSGALQGGQPPRCQVEGCQVDLSDAKAYYSRHKVCGMHSKSPKVIVAGLEQRFCQQCSRFHQLPEFDQAKRSCRRRLAGHNERRRKPPPGSISSPHYGSLSSSIFETSSRGGGFLMDFSAYPNLMGHDSWPNARASDHASNNHSASTGRFLQLPRHSNSESPPSELLLQGSVTRSGFAGPGITSGDCFTGVSDSSRALSLLSNQPWCSRNRPSSLGANNMLSSNGTPLVQPSGTHGVPISHFSSPSWGFKGNEATSSTSHDMHPGLDLGPISQDPNYQYPGQLEMAQQRGRQYLELDQSRGYDSSVQHVHWSL